MLQLMDALQEPLGLSQVIQQGILVLLLVGFPVTLVLAWYHGEQGRQRVSGSELLIVVGLLLMPGLFSFRVFASDGVITEGASAPDGPAQPSVAVLPFVNMSGNPDNEYFSDVVGPTDPAAQLRSIMIRRVADVDPLPKSNDESVSIRVSTSPFRCASKVPPPSVSVVEVEFSVPESELVMVSR